MKEIYFTFTGEKNHAVHFSDLNINEDKVKSIIREKLSIPIQDDFDIFDSNFAKIDQVSSILDCCSDVTSQVYYLCIINQNRF